jgi:hypothetical protein
MKTMERIYLVGLGVLLALVTLLVLLGLAAILAPPEQPAMTVQSQAATRFTDLTIDNDLTVGGEVDAGTLDCTEASFTDFSGETITATVGFVGDLTGDVVGDLTGDVTGAISVTSPVTVSGMAFTYTAPLTITSVVTDVRLLIYQEE